MATIQTTNPSDIAACPDGTDAQSEVCVIRDGHGFETLGGFNATQDSLVFDMDEISDFEDVLDRMTQSGADTVITFNNGDALTLPNVDSGALSPANFAYSAGPVCLLEGTPIFTERGEVPIEELRPDDIVWTKDHGWQAIRVVVQEKITFLHRNDPQKPILIPAGALSDQQPSCSLIASPQHRILQIRPETGEEELVPAGKLVGRNGIRRMRGRKSARYFNVVMERHSIIQASGCWVESLYVTSHSLCRQKASARKLLDLAIGMKPARRIEKEGVRPRRLKIA